MTISERVKICRLDVKLQSNKEFARRLGVEVLTKTPPGRPTPKFTKEVQ